MKKEDLQRTAAYHNGVASKVQEKETVVDKFTTWFRNFLDNSE